MATYSSSPKIEYVSYQQQFTGSNLPSNGNLVHTDTHTFVSDVPENVTYQAVYSFMASTSGALTLVVKARRNEFTNWSNLGSNFTDSEPYRMPNERSVWSDTAGGTSNTAQISQEKHTESVLTNKLILPDNKITIEFTLDNVEGAEYAAYYVQFIKTTFP